VIGNDASIPTVSRLGNFSLSGGGVKSVYTTAGLPRLFIIPVDETVRFRFAKPESLIYSRLKGAAFSTNPSMFEPSKYLSTPRCEGRENTLAGLNLYYL
jgi:hypothetical protein